MARICREVDQWITEQVQQPLENWVNQTEQRCYAQSCNWWCLCCNKWLCFLVTIVVRIITWVTVTISRLVTQIVCEIVNLVLDLGAYIVNLILSIPVIGGIIRTILNGGNEIIWRLVDLPNFILTLVGVQLPKKMYMKLVILNSEHAPIASEASIMPSIRLAQDIYRRECNINLIYTGVCIPKNTAPSEALTISCDAGGYFADWWVAGSYYEYTSADCGFEDGFRRVTGIGAEIIVFIVKDVTPNNTIGCSMGPVLNYVVIQANSPDCIAHEIGHACGLWHVTDVNNLMNPELVSTALHLDNGQRAILRNSRHCTFL